MRQCGPALFGVRHPRGHFLSCAGAVAPLRKSSADFLLSYVLLSCRLPWLLLGTVLCRVLAWQEHLWSLSLCSSSIPPSRCSTTEECPHTVWGGFTGAPRVSTAASHPGTLKAPCPPEQGPRAGSSALPLARVSTQGLAQGLRLPGWHFLTVPLFPLLTGTLSTSSWTPPWACCSSTWACVPSASWWSGSSGSPCVLVNMVTYRGHGLPGGDSAPCPVQPSRPVHSEKVQELALSLWRRSWFGGLSTILLPVSECPTSGHVGAHLTA